MPDPVRVLAVSDSLLWGTGRASVDATWARQLDLELNRRHGVGSHEVVTLARVDSSFLDYAEWLTSARIAEIDPDVIIVGYYLNDSVPSGYERVLCPQETRCRLGTMATLPGYQRCISGREGAFGWFARNILSRLYPNLAAVALRRVCDNGRFRDLNGFDEFAAYGDPTVNPYRVYLPDAARRIVSNAAGRPVILLPTPTDQTGWRATRQYLPLLLVDGVTLADITRTLAVIPTGFEDKKFWTTPIDMHPTEELARRFAQDAADMVERLPLDIPESTVSSQPIRPLVADVNPSALQVRTSGDDVVTLTLPSPDSDEMARHSITHASAGRSGAVQQVPCAHMGRPHLRIDLDPLRTSGRGVELRLSPGGPRRLAVLAVGYRQDGELVRMPLRTLQPGEGLVVPAEFPLDHLLVGTPASGCPTDAPLVFPAVELGIRLV